MDGNIVLIGSIRRATATNDTLNLSRDSEGGHFDTLRQAQGPNSMQACLFRQACFDRLSTGSASSTGNDHARGCSHRQAQRERWPRAEIFTSTEENQMTGRIVSALIIVWNMTGCGRDVPTSSEVGAELKGFKLAGRMNFQRFWPASVLLQDGRVLITGGSRTDRPYHSSSAFRHASAELFDPDTGTSTATGNMSVSRFRDRAMLLPDGRVLIKGTPFDPPEVYDPRSGSFIAMEGRPELTRDATITALPTGDLLTTDTQGSVSRFDPDSWEFQFLTKMDVPRSDHSATLLQDGRVLIVGGANATGALKRADVYDPSSNTLVSGWRSAARTLGTLGCTPSEWHGVDSWRRDRQRR